MKRVEKCEPAGQGKVGAISGKVRSALDEVLREGARQMLLAAIEAEVTDSVEKHQQEKDSSGHCLVVRNGLGKERGITTPMGELRVRAPRVNDQRRQETVAGLQ